MRTTISHEFVEFIPETLTEGVLYVCIPYATVIHKCLCGCGNEVVTPLAPRQWSLVFNGEAVSLTPSIGNWSFPCRSHYWICHGKVQRARLFTDDEISDLRDHDAESLRQHYEAQHTSPDEKTSTRRRWPKRCVAWIRRTFS